MHRCIKKVTPWKRKNSNTILITINQISDVWYTEYEYINDGDMIWYEISLYRDFIIKYGST